MGKNLPLRSRVRTNIGTTVPPARPLTEAPQRLNPPRDGVMTGVPVALPVAQFEGEEPRVQLIAPDPLWVSRWQNSKTPVGRERPWVKGYRWWVAGVKYETWGPDPLYRIDIMWKDHKHAYTGIPRDLWEDFRKLTGSVGEWFHKFILPPNWRPGMGAMWPNFPL